MKNINVLMLFGIMFVSLFAQAQVFSESMGQAELKKRGLEEEEVRQELLSRGIDVDAIDINNPSEVIQVEQTIRQVLSDLEAKKKNTASLDTIVPPSLVEEDTFTVQSGMLSRKQDQEVTSKAPVTVFGQQLYRNGNIKTFDNLGKFRPSGGYIVGPGDKLTASIWGLTEESYNLEVSSDGYVKPKGRPRVYIGGLTLARAKEKIRLSMKRYHTFNKDEFEVAITTARDIVVNIVGEVGKNGAFNLSSINNAINALSLAGGPSDIGSLRNIKLVSYGDEPRQIDLYRYLFDPISAENLYLKNNDYISVPTAELIVQVIGEVRRPLKYEMKSTESLADLIKYAGGATPFAYGASIRIQRVSGANLEILNVDLTKEGSNFRLQNGDIITVPKINEMVENVIFVQGAVKNEGPYAYEEGLRVSDVSLEARLMKSAYLDVAFIHRLNDDKKTYTYEIINLADALAQQDSSSDPILRSGDKLVVYDKSEFVDNYEVVIEGPVRNPGAFALDGKDQLKVADLILMAGGQVEELAAFGYIFRRKPGSNSELKYIRVAIDKILANPASSDNITLQPNDRLILKDIDFFQEESFVKIGGAVRNPGQFQYSPSLSVQDVLALAGGLKREAAPYKIDLYRIDFAKNKSTKTIVANLQINENLEVENGEVPLFPFDEIYVRYAPEFELVQTIQVQGEVKFPGEYALLNENPRLTDVLSQAGGLTNEAFASGATLYRNEKDMGYIVINLTEAMKSKGSFADVILKKGDVIYLPKQSSVVSIGGATNIRDQYPAKLINNGMINIAFEEGMRADDYVKKYAGGFANNADRKNLTVEYADGRVKKSRKRLFGHSYPKIAAGAKIKIPAKSIEIEEQKDKSDVDWGKTLSNTVAQATAILSLLLLVRTLD